MEKYTEKRPWGKFERFTLNEQSTIKILTINPGEKLSLQYHNQREEFWKVIEGEGKIILGEEILEAKKGDEFIIKKGQKHRIIGTKAEMKILEISFGTFNESDNIRLEDIYSRESPK